MAKINKPYQSAKMAKVLLAKRNAENLSTRAAAEKAGVTYPTFNRAEFGENISFDALVSLCNWLEKPVQYFFS